MKAKGPGLDRRNFLISAAGVASAVATGLGRAATPCPPSTLAVEGGTSVNTSCEPAVPGQLPTLTLTSAAASGTYGWTFGHAFKKGDVPSGSHITSNANSTQADVRNRWSDGSVKFAVISGVAAFTQNSPKAIQLATSSSAPGGANVGEPGSLDASVTFSGAVSGTYSVQSALGVNKQSWSSQSGAGRVRQFLGPVMSEFHYYVPTNDAHVTVWFYVRRYASGATEVETVVENGWARVASPVEKSYSISVNVGGSQRYSASIAHRHHSRWSRRDWIGTDPQVTPRHNSAYLKSTKLVPNYAAVALSSSMLSSLVQSAAPMTRGNFDQGAAGGGYHPHLGLLPLWDAAYVVSGDVRAYRSMLANEQASNCCRFVPGEAGFSTRDERTGYPMNLVDFYQDSYSNGYSPDYGSGKVYVGHDNSSAPWATDPAHSWAAGYLAYLVTGRWFSLETAQFCAGAEFMTWGIPGGGNDGQRWMAGEDRHAAWALRQLACAAAITPDSGNPLRAGYITYLNTALNKWRTNEVGFNNLGVRRNIYNYTDYAPSPYLSCGAFQQSFVAQSFPFGYDIAGELVSAGARTQWLEAVRFHAQFPVGLLGTRPAGYCFRRAGLYGIAVGPNRSTGRTTFFANWAEVYDAAVATGAIPGGESCAAGSTLLGGNFPDASSYWGNLYPAAAYAKDFGVSGADAAWSRLTGASNHSELVEGFGTYPHFGIVPR